MTGKWKYIKMLLVIVYPYLYMLAFLGIFMVAFIEDNTNQSYDYTLLAMIISIILGLSITIICLVICLYNSIRSGKNSYGIVFPAKMNLLIKCIQIPAYIINFILGFIGLLMSIWGIGIIAFVFIIDLITITLSGTNNVGNCINLYQNKALTKAETIVFTILSYTYVVDVFICVYLFIKAKRCYNTKKLENN